MGLSRENYIHCAENVNNAPINVGPTHISHGTVYIRPCPAALVLLFLSVKYQSRTFVKMLTSSSKTIKVAEPAQQRSFSGPIYTTCPAALSPPTTSTRSTYAVWGLSMPTLPSQAQWPVPSTGTCSSACWWHFRCGRSGTGGCRSECGHGQRQRQAHQRSQLGLQRIVTLLAFTGLHLCSCCETTPSRRPWRPSKESPCCRLRNRRTCRGTILGPCCHGGPPCAHGFARPALPDRGGWGSVSPEGACEGLHGLHQGRRVDQYTGEGDPFNRTLTPDFHRGRKRRGTAALIADRWSLPLVSCIVTHCSSTTVAGILLVCVRCLQV